MSKNLFDIQKNKIKDNRNNKSNCILEKLRSDYFLRKIYDNICKNKSLRIIKYNKKIQYRLNLSIKDYKEYSELFSSIEIEIIPKKDYYGKFIRINNNEEVFYHIYLNDNKKEIKNKYEINKEDKVSKIKIIIDYQVKSFEDLFYECKCIKSINFKKFYRTNINNMSWMFGECSSLEELNISNIITNNVTNMSWMFFGCTSLKKLNLSNFNTNNVTDMGGIKNRKI